MLLLVTRNVLKMYVTSCISDPLPKWNPFKLKYKGEFSSTEGKTVFALNENGLRRNGLQTEERAFNGTNSRRFYQTPASFFMNQKDRGDPADTTRNGVGVLDEEGNLHITMATGARITFPDIPGVGVVRQRYPIVPLHTEGNSIEKKVSALEDALMQMQKYLPLFQNDPPFKMAVNVSSLDKTYTFYTGYSHKPELVEDHWHSFTVTASDFIALKSSETKTFITSYDNGHNHEVGVRYKSQAVQPYFFISTCGNYSYCWDKHGKTLLYTEN